MSYLIGYVKATYDQLVEKYGEPEEGDGYKVSLEWSLPGNMFIYDWKSTNLYEDYLPPPDALRTGVHTWNVGGVRGQSIPGMTTKGV